MKKSFYGFIGILLALCLGFAACGDSKSGDSTTPGDNPTAPGPVTNFQAAAGNGQVVLSWTAPSNNGGSPIIRYEVSSNNGTSWVSADTSTGHTFSGLSNGTLYTFRVRAVNAIGGGSQSTQTATPIAGPGDPLEKLAITISRAANTVPGQFIFSTNTVTGATAYKAYKGATEVGTSATTTVSVASSALTDSPYTELSAKALKGSEDASLATLLPGIVKYSAETPTLEAYTDWFKFLKATLESLRIAANSAYTPYAVLHTTIKTALTNQAANTGFNTESGAQSVQMDYETEANQATKAVLDNWLVVWDDLITDPAAASDLEATKNTMPKLWFNQVTDTANDATLGNIVKPELEAAYTDVTISN